MYKINLISAWVGIWAGFVFGAILGLFFYKEDWLGGYNSWKRRMLRLSHVSLFGIAIINMFFFYTCNFLQAKGAGLASMLLVVAAISMPLICILAAFNQKFRHLFFVPVLSLLTGSALLIINELLK